MCRDFDDIWVDFDRLREETDAMIVALQERFEMLEKRLAATQARQLEREKFNVLGQMREVRDRVSVPGVATTATEGYPQTVAPHLAVASRAALSRGGR